MVSAGYILPVTLTAMQQAQAQGLAASAIASAVSAVLAQPTTMIVLTVIGLATSLAGGYVAGRVAGWAEALHGLAMAVALKWLLSLGAPASATLWPVWLTVLATALNWGAAALGGYWAQLRRPLLEQRAARTPKIEWAGCVVWVGGGLVVLVVLWLVINHVRF